MLRRFVILLAIYPPLMAQSESAMLEIRIVEGEGMEYAGGSRATSGIAVQVLDETGSAVEGANVVFRLPDHGPTGVFSSGARMELAVTGADGRAAAWGMRWNKTVGPLELQVSVNKGQTRGSLMFPLTLTEPEARPPRTYRKAIWFALAIGGGLGAALAIRGGVSSAGANGTASAVNGPTIGVPTIAISHP